MRTTGTKAEIVAYLTLCKRAMGYPTPGIEIGRGPHVSDVPMKRSLGMVPVTDEEGDAVLDDDGNPVTYEAWETLHNAHVPCTTRIWDTPRQHPTKPLLWDCEALTPGMAKVALIEPEKSIIWEAYDNAKPAGDDWDPGG